MEIFEKLPDEINHLVSEFSSTPIVGGLVLEARGERRDISVKTQLRIAQETLANSANSYGGEA